ncbi:hypothetical protein BH09PLA1_BH09PLA1_15770 [soil metagenome]
MRSIHLASRCSLAIFGIAALFLSGCGGGGVSSQFKPTERVARFGNERWAGVLSQVATPAGYVRWEAIQSNDNGVRDDLFRYVGLLGEVSPDNRPELFPSADDKLTYWLNAYNALAMYAVVKRNYPGNTLASIPPGAIYLIDSFPVGGKSMTLDSIEKSKVRSVGDPRVHFALNCMSRSCPPLRREPYEASKLNAQLSDQGMSYLSDPRAVTADARESVKLNDIFTSFYKGDFVDAYRKKTGNDKADLLESIRPFAAKDSPVQSATRYSGMGYDWSLNRPPE